MQGESNSITNQKQLLESYAKRNGFVNIYHYTDDGVSGTTFDREGFQKMIKAVEENKVSTLDAFLQISLDRSCAVSRIVALLVPMFSSLFNVSMLAPGMVV